MDTAADRAPPRTPPPGGAGAAGRPQTEMHEASFLEPLERALATLKRMATNYALLAILDLRRAAVQLAWLVGAGIVITVLVVTAWLATVVAVAVWLLGQGLSWPGVLLVAALLNLVAAAIVAWRIRNVFERAPFAAILRQLKAESPAEEKGAPK